MLHMSPQHWLDNIPDTIRTSFGKWYRDNDGPVSYYWLLMQMFRAIKEEPISWLYMQKLLKDVGNIEDIKQAIDFSSSIPDEEFAALNQLEKHEQYKEDTIREEVEEVGSSKILKAAMNTLHTSKFKIFLAHIFGKKDTIVLDHYIVTTHEWKGKIYLTDYSVCANDAEPATCLHIISEFSARENRYIYHTSCGTEFAVVTKISEEKLFKYCSYCGKHLKFLED